MDLSFDHCCMLIKKFLAKSSNLYQYLDYCNQQANTFLVNGYILQYNAIRYALSKIKEEIEEELGIDYSPLDNYLENECGSIPDRPMELTRKLILKGINECVEENKESFEMLYEKIIEIIGTQPFKILINGGIDTYLTAMDKQLLNKHHYVCLEPTQADCIGKCGLKSTFILPSQLFTIMPKIDIVLINAIVLSSDTSIIAMNGTLNTCHVAKYNKIPIVVVVTNNSICSKHFQELTTAKQLKIENTINAPTPRSNYDIIPLDLVDILCTSQGLYPSSYAYQLVREYSRGFKVE